MTKKKSGTRDPIAADLRTPKYRKRIAKSEAERDEQKDAWSKKAKHKKVSLDEFYQVGDKVDIIKGPLKKVLDRAEQLSNKGAKEGDKVKKKTEKPHGIVRDPDGPANTLGITVDGEFHLIDEDDVELIFEGFNDYEDLTEWSYADATSGIRVPISGEENDILKKCTAPLYKTDLDDRDQEVARRMVSRGVLHRRKDDKGIYFVSDNQKLTRF